MLRPGSTFADVRQHSKPTPSSPQIVNNNISGYVNGDVVKVDFVASLRQQSLLVARVRVDHLIREREEKLRQAALSRCIIAEQNGKCGVAKRFW